MDEYHELLLKIKGAYRGKNPPIVYPENKTMVSGFVLKIPEDKLEALKQKGLVEILYFPKLDYKKVKITEKGNSFMSDFSTVKPI
jgi:hypothetical protein